MEFLEVFLYNVNILRTKEKVIQREDLYNEEKNVCSTYGSVHDSIRIRKRGNSQRSRWSDTDTLRKCR